MTIRTIIVVAIASLGITGTGLAQFNELDNTVEFTNSGQTLGNTNSWSVALGDLDGDGHLDAMATNHTVWLNDGSGNFTNTGQAVGSGNSISVALGDLDGDGHLDVMLANFNQPNTVWLNDGSGNFTDSGQALGSNSSKSVALGDVDGDGDLDAMVANGCAPNCDTFNTVWLNDGSGNFTDSMQALGNNESFSVALGDVDGDGDLDAFVGNDFKSAVWTNDGNGTFTNSLQELYCDLPYSVALGDLDGDGHLDAMAANYGGHNPVWTNDGSGNFTNSGQVLGNNDSTSVALGDFDGDSDLDAMVANSFQPNTVWLNDGSGTLTDSGQALGNTNSWSVALGDVDGDGELDAMVANFSTTPSTVWTNDASGISAVYNQTSGVWYDSAREAIAVAEAHDTLLVGGSSFDIPGVVDARELPLTFSARAPAVFGEDLMFLAAVDSSFLDYGPTGGGYVLKGSFILPGSESILFSSLDIELGGRFIQDTASVFFSRGMNNESGLAFLEGNIFSFESMISTGADGENRVAGDTNIFCDYTNAGTTIIQRGILYIYGDLIDTGTMVGNYDTGPARGGRGGGRSAAADAPQPGDGLNIGGHYQLGSDASLTMNDFDWTLAIGGDLDIAIDAHTRFAISGSTFKMTGLSGHDQLFELMSLDVGEDADGFDPSLPGSFPVGTFHVASGATVNLADNHDNAGDGRAVCEALYASNIIVEAGATLSTGGCAVYAENATINGTVDGEIIIIDTSCPGDATGDLLVNLADFTQLLIDFGTTGESPADFNGDNSVDLDDFSILLVNFGNSCQ